MDDMSNDHPEHDELYKQFGEPYSETIESRSPLPPEHVVGISPVRAQLEDAERQARKKPKITGKPFQQFVAMSVWYQFQSVTIDRFHDSEWNRNICDYLIQSGNMTAWVEAKTTSTSMPFHDVNNPKKSKFKQQPLLLSKSIRCKEAGTRHRNMIGVLVEFKRKGVPFVVWWVDIDDILWLEENNGRKSFNTKDLEELHVTSRDARSFPIQYYKPPRARKNYLNIRLMMSEKWIDSSAQLEDS